MSVRLQVLAQQLKPKWVWGETFNIAFHDFKRATVKHRVSKGSRENRQPLDQIRTPNREKPRQISQELKSRELSFCGFMSCNSRSATSWPDSQNGNVVWSQPVPWFRGVVLLSRCIHVLGFHVLGCEYHSYPSTTISVGQLKIQPTEDRAKLRCQIIFYVHYDY